MKEKMNVWTLKAHIAAKDFIEGTSGNGLTDFLGSLIIGALVIVLIVTAVNAFAPGFIQKVFDQISRDILG